MRTKFKAWAEPYINEHQEVMLSSENANKLDNFYLEIGSGKGQFLLLMAKKFPECQFIGVERNVTCAGFTAKKLVENINEVNNAKLVYDNADNLLINLKDKSVKTIFLNFSDPWPKKRHSKRRLTSINYLNNYKRILKDDGKIIFKTDNFDLFTFTLEVVNESEFLLLEKNDNYQDEDPFDAISEYEANFRALGQPIYRMVLVKKHD